MLDPIFNTILQLFIVLSILSIIIGVGNADGNNEHIGINFLWKPLRWLRHWILQRWHNTHTEYPTFLVHIFYSRNRWNARSRQFFSLMVAFLQKSCSHGSLLASTDTYHKYKFKCANHWWPYRKYKYKDTYPIPLEIQKSLPRRKWRWIQLRSVREIVGKYWVYDQ